MGGGTNLRKRENKWISTGKKTNGLVQVKTEGRGPT